MVFQPLRFNAASWLVAFLSWICVLSFSEAWTLSSHRGRNAIFYHSTTTKTKRTTLPECKRQQRFITSLSSSDLDEVVENSLRRDATCSANEQTRRQWMHRAGQILASPFLPVIATSRPSYAASVAVDEAPTATALVTTTDSPQVREVVTSSAVCDPTVSVWKEPNRNRLVYILGTAHISEVSAKLASQLVQDIHPDAVFVELDLRRVAGLERYKTSQPATPSQLAPSSEQQQRLLADESTVTTYVTPTATVVVPKVTPRIGGTNAGLPPPFGDSSSDESPPPALPAPSRQDESGGGLFGGMRRAALNFASNAIGSAVRNMYQNLGDAGFSPGEEFAAAISEGQKIGAAIVLGDQDVQLTLRRLTQALTVTDLSKFNDIEFQNKLNEIMPNMGGTSANPTAIDPDMSAISKEELTAFVETMRTRGNVRAIMTQLREVAPALVQVMLTERDVYMATGLDTLNQFECIVAVMGVAHMDGVELNLRERGWQPVILRCPVLAP